MKFTYVFMFFLSTSVCWAQVPIMYDDVGVHDNYSYVLKTYNSMSERQIQEGLLMSKNDFKGVNDIEPIPVILNQDQSMRLQAGTKQLARLYKAFYADINLGESARIYQSNILSTSDVSLYMNSQSSSPTLINPNFMVATDLILHKNNFYLIEAGVTSYAGGIGDMQLARDSFFKSYPKYWPLELMSKGNPIDFYNELEKVYAEDNINSGAKVLLQHHSSVLPNGYGPKKNRILNIFREMGFKDVTVELSGLVSRDSPNALVKIKDDIYVVNSRTLELERIGFVHLDMQSSFLKHKIPLNMLITAHNKGRLRLNISPGAENLSNKHLLTVLEKLSYFYLNEELIFKVPSTVNLKDYTDAELLKTFQDPNLVKNFVFKSLHGRGGEDVYLGTDLTHEFVIKDGTLVPNKKYEKIINHILHRKDYFIRQEHISLPEKLGKAFDLRTFGYINSKDTVASSVIPWSRSAPVGEKTNLTGRYGKASQNAVFILGDEFLKSGRFLLNSIKSKCSSLFSRGH